MPESKVYKTEPDCQPVLGPVRTFPKTVLEVQYFLHNQDRPDKACSTELNVLITTYQVGLGYAKSTDAEDNG